MTLGEKIRAARLEKHMTQKQVVGTYITRNMLSQIENGSAVPSVKTLEYLADVLGLPAGYFLTETAETADVPESLTAARSFFRDGAYEACIRTLEAFMQPAEKVQPAGDLPEAHGEITGTAGIPEPVRGYADELFLLRARAEICLAESAFAAGQTGFAAAQAQSAIRDNACTLYESDALRTEALLLLARCSLAQGGQPDEEIRQCREAYRAQGLCGAYHLTMAEYRLARGEQAEARQELEQISWLSESSRPAYRMLRGKLALAERDYQTAAQELEQAEKLAENRGETGILPGIYAMLEVCWRELEDFRKAYHYAALQLQLWQSDK